MNQAAQDGETEFISMMIREVPDFEFDFSTEVYNMVDIIAEYLI